MEFVSVVIDIDLKMEESDPVCDSQETDGIIASLLQPNGAPQTAAVQVTKVVGKVVVEVVAGVRKQIYDDVKDLSNVGRQRWKTTMGKLGNMPTVGGEML
ncbi:hypothetical protein R1flu_000027 [Riccia fluitans]|uniref:Uncharacterized protein n=1 Tax=Riccia fluitans TaxID=41844 RepID=A0ABD1Y294_9MARC